MFANFYGSSFGYNAYTPRYNTGNNYSAYNSGYAGSSSYNTGYRGNNSGYAGSTNYGNAGSSNSYGGGWQSFDWGGLFSQLSSWFGNLGGYNTQPQYNPQPQYNTGYAGNVNYTPAPSNPYTPPANPYTPPPVNTYPSNPPAPSNPYTPPANPYNPAPVPPSYSKDNPYMLTGNTVSFTYKEAPQFVNYKNNVYELKKSKDGQIDYFNGDLKKGIRNLHIIYDQNGKAVPVTNNDTTGYGYGYNPYTPPPEYNVKYKTNSPLVFDLNGDGIQTTQQNRLFNIDGRGGDELISSLGADDGTLVFDGDGDGRFGESGLELFGNNTDLNGDGQADGFGNGFEALGGFATQALGAGAVADGRLDANEIRQLDAAGLRMDVNGQLHSLRQLGITGINLNFNNSSQVDAFGNQFRQQSSFERNGRQQSLIDIWFSHQA